MGKTVHEQMHIEKKQTGEAGANGTPNKISSIYYYIKLHVKVNDLPFLSLDTCVFYRICNL